MTNTNQPLIKASVAIVLIAGILGVVAVLAGDISAITGKISAVSFALLIFGITATICMVVTRKPEYRILGLSGAAVSVIGFFVFSILTVGEVAEEGILKIAFASLIMSIALAHICLLHHFELQNKYALYARITATVAISFFSLSLLIKVFGSVSGWYALGYDQSTLKLIIAALIVDLAATLLVPLCNRLKSENPVDLILSSEEKTETDIPQ